MDTDQTKDREGTPLPSVMDGKARKRFGRSSRRIDLKRLRQIGIANLPMEVRLPASRCVSQSTTKIINTSGRSAFLFRTRYVADITQDNSTMHSNMSISS